MADFKELGKIQRFDVGIGGYQDAMLGVHITLGGSGWGVSTDMCTWSPARIPIGKYTKWTEKDRSKRFDEVMRFIDKTLSEAKVMRTQDLIGVPIEATFEEHRTIKSWRILKEVL
jgi:hypothetical protein